MNKDKCLRHTFSISFVCVREFVDYHEYTYKNICSKKNKRYIFNVKVAGRQLTQAIDATMSYFKRSSSGRIWVQSASLWWNQLQRRSEEGRLARCSSPRLRSTNQSGDQQTLGQLTSCHDKQCGCSKCNARWGKLKWP